MNDARSNEGSSVSARGAQGAAQSTSQARPDSQSRRRAPQELSPLVDIREDADGITLYADMPGVSRERLDVQLDGNTLLIEGALQIDLPTDMHSVHADVRSMVYRRSFTLSNELESQSVAANLKDGVLTLRIPKRAEVRARRIEVRTG